MSDFTRMNLHDIHNGQTVKPVVEFRRIGNTHEVRYAWHDATDPDAPLDWKTLKGDYHQVAHQLKRLGIESDDHRF